MGWEFFIPAQTLIAVFLLSCLLITTNSLVFTVHDYYAFISTFYCTYIRLTTTHLLVYLYCTYISFYCTLLRKYSTSNF